MDPISLAIISSLNAGILSGGGKLAEKVIIDGYDALKGLIQKKFGKDSDVNKAIENLEEKPNSDGRKATLQEEVVSAEADQDIELIKAAENLIAILKNFPSSQETVKQIVTGDRNIFSGTGNVSVTKKDNKK